MRAAFWEDQCRLINVSCLTAPTNGGSTTLRTMSTSTQSDPVIGSVPINRSKFPHPTARQWLIHVMLFAVTVCTTTLCGIIMGSADSDAGAGVSAGTGGFAGTLWLIPWYYLSAV